MRANYNNRQVPVHFVFNNHSVQQKQLSLCFVDKEQMQCLLRQGVYFGCARGYKSHLFRGTCNFFIEFGMFLPQGKVLRDIA